MAANLGHIYVCVVNRIQNSESCVCVCVCVCECVSESVRSGLLASLLHTLASRENDVRIISYPSSPHDSYGWVQNVYDEPNLYRYPENFNWLNTLKTRAPVMLHHIDRVCP